MLLAGLALKYNPIDLDIADIRNDTLAKCYEVDRQNRAALILEFDSMDFSVEEVGDLDDDGQMDYSVNEELKSWWKEKSSENYETTYTPHAAEVFKAFLEKETKNKPNALKDLANKISGN